MLNRLDALGEASPFEGFDEADFDAFLPKKQGSRVYTMERRATRAKTVALARDALARSGAGAEFELGASDDAPSMANQRKVEAIWAYLTRPDGQRSAIASKLGRTDLSDRAALFDTLVEHQHLSLLFRVDLDGFATELHLSPRAGVDRTNVLRKLAYAEDRAALLELLQGLEGAQAGFEGALLPAADVDEAKVESWAAEMEASSTPFVVRQVWSREDGKLQAPEFGDAVGVLAEGLIALYRHLAWSTDNDFAKIGVEKAVAKAEKKIEKAKGGAVELAPGARVTILSGLFAGRSGYLAEPDGKGNVKVMVGPVSVSVPTGDIKPA